jgi:exopolyphosphatase/guanosine-5'-triphosphate,3'-diphosphate pyrophosphatase
MVVARQSHGQLSIIDRLREMVQLAAGLDAKNHLDEDSQRRALDCLSRFGERIRDMHASRVRVVGTNTLRTARSATAFYRQAAELLGHPIQVISGMEEARLIYLGVSRSLPMVDGPQIVVDIGGGSTEIIRGHQHHPDKMESCHLGCIGVSESCFPNGKLTAKRFDRARLMARLEFEPIRSVFLGQTPERFAGASGTIRAVCKVLEAREETGDVITYDGVRSLIGEMIAAGSMDALETDVLPGRRKAVFPGGVAILIELMEALKIDRMVVADGAMREGILYDMVGRFTDEDARVLTVRSMEARFNIDSEQADRIEATARVLYRQVAAAWSLNDAVDEPMLIWAARLHEIGLDIAHARYQDHGAYLLEYADMPGFTHEEQQVLARLVRGHRHRIDSKLCEEMSGRCLYLTALLRLAVLIHRSRTELSPPRYELRVKGHKISATISAQWLNANPLTLASLEREQKYLADAGLQLNLKILDEEGSR